MRLMAGVFAMLIASAIGCKKAPPPLVRVETSAAQKARLDEIVLAAKNSARMQDEARRAVAAQRSPALVPVPGLGACPVTAKTLVPEDPESSDTDNGKRALVAKRSSRLIRLTDVWQNGAPDSKDGPATRSVASLADEERGALDRGSYPAASAIDAAIAKLEAALKQSDDGYDVTFVVSRLVKPVPKGDKKFQSGRIAGTVYLWSRAQRAIVCATEIASFNADRVRIHDDDATWLEQNLIETAVLEALPRLVRVAPP